MRLQVLVAVWSMLLGATLAAVAVDCYGDPRAPEITLGGKCYEGTLYVYCTDDVLVRDGACKLATTGAETCSVSNYQQYRTWKPKHPGYRGFGRCESETDCEVENSYWSHVATNSGICQMNED